SFICFFFQAEDGIRDPLVTGVQTCALPIYQRAVARQVLKVRPGHFDQRAAGTAVRARHGEEPILIHDERERSQEDAFDPAEDGGVGADAEHQAEDGQQGKPGTASKHAEAVAKILNHRVCLRSPESASPRTYGRTRGRRDSESRPWMPRRLRESYQSV